MKSLRQLLGHEVPKAKLKSKFPFTAAGVERLLDMGESKVPQKVFSTNTLYASSLGYNTAAEYVYNYYEPKAKIFPYKVALAMEIGTAAHAYYQERLMRAGVLYPQAEDGDKYKEVRIECPEYRLVGKIDGLVCQDQLKEMGDSKWDLSKQWLPRPMKMDLLEIKVLASHNYKITQGPEDISKPYRMQATAMQKISNYDKTIFMIVNRDSLQFRFVEYIAEESIWEEIKTLSKTVFKHLKDLSMPDGFNPQWLPPGLTYEQWVQLRISQSPKKKWFHLTDKDEPEYEQQELPFFLN